MRQVTITITANTELTAEDVKQQLRAWLSELLETVTNIDVTGIEVETVSADEFTKLDEMIADQTQWIKDHGGDLLGYHKHYGNDGVALYKADLAELHRLQDLLSSRALNRALGCRLEPLS